LKSYETRQQDESRMTPPAKGLQSRREEVWLRGNVRPLLAAVAGVLLAGLVGLAMLVLAGGAALLLIAATVVLTVVAAGGGLLVMLASAPRLTRAGEVAVVRLGPWHRDEVPLEIMECFFLGSAGLGRRLIVGSCDERGEEPVGSATGGDGDEHRRRRSTLVIRLAERARDFHDRSAALPWGGWAGGAIVFDGMWCEQLSPALVRDLTGRLVAAQREVKACR
jgi:hypothetical protein